MVDTVVRTAKGTAKQKVSGTTLTVADVALVRGSSVIVGIVYENSGGNPTSVKWGGRDLTERVVQNNATAGIRVAIWSIRNINNTDTRDIVATWGSAIGKKVMFVTELAGVNLQDDKASNDETTETADPVTGATTSGGLELRSDFAICVFGSEGPSSDTPGTPQIQDGGVYQSATTGQRDGTLGAPPISNVTIHETYLELNELEPTEGRLQSATSRHWANAILVLRRFKDFRTAISPSDLEEATRIFGLSPQRDLANAVFHFDTVNERWELYEATDIGTLVATREVDSIEWVVE